MSTNLFRNIFYFSVVFTFYICMLCCALCVEKRVQNRDGGVGVVSRQTAAIDTNFMILLWLCHRFILSL